MSEWFKEAVLKTVVLRERDRGFESLSLRQLRHRWLPMSQGPIEISYSLTPIAERWPSRLKALAC